MRKLSGVKAIVLNVCLFFAFTSTLQAQSAGCVPAPDGLVAWWRGESTALDSAGTNNGVTMGGVVFTNSEVGRGFAFTGSGDDYVQLPQNIFPFPTEGNGFAPFSFEVWFKTVASGVILGQQDGAPFDSALSGNVSALYVGTNGILFAALFWSGGTQLQTQIPVNDGRFHHVVVTFDGSTETLYMDGQPQASSPFVQQGYATNYWYELGTGWTDGWPDTPGGWFPFTGIVDEASLYNRALLPAEITSLYVAGTAGKCDNTTGPALLHRYSFSGNPGDRRVFDSVGGAVGTLYYYGPTAPHTNGVPDGSSFTGTGQLNLAGSNGYVRLPEGLLSSLTNLSFEAWVTWNGPATSVWQRIFDFGYSDAGINASGFGTNYIILCPARGGTSLLAFEETTLNPFGGVLDPNALVLSGPDTMPLGRQVFIAVTYDPVAGQTKLYVDGALVASASGTLNPLNRIVDRNNWLGRSQWQRDPFFNGVFDEFRIWEGILGPEDVANHYASGPNQPFAIPRPWLQVERSIDHLTISWSTNHATGFGLESSPGLRSPSWSAVTNSPAILNGAYRVTLPSTGSGAFFRLRR